MQILHDIYIHYAMWCAAISPLIIRQHRMEELREILFWFNFQIRITPFPLKWIATA